MLAILIILISAVFHWLGIIPSTYLIAAAITAQVWILLSVITRKQASILKFTKMYYDYKLEISKKKFFKYLIIGSCIGSFMISSIVMSMIATTYIPFNAVYLLALPLLIETAKMIIVNNILCEVKKDLL